MEALIRTFIQRSSVMTRFSIYLRGSSSILRSSSMLAASELNISDKSVTDLSKSERKSLLRNNRRNAKLEKASRLKNLKIPLDRVLDDWLSTSGPKHVMNAAEHYGIFKDILMDCSFIPKLNFEVTYTTNQVQWGNILFPEKAAIRPVVSLPPKCNDDLWTLIMINPDGTFIESQEGSGFLHWLLINIRPSTDDGLEACKYVQPLPIRGTGYHRFVFLLCKQSRELSISNKFADVSDRCFSTYDFFNQHKDALEPIGLRFFQANWDESVTETFQSEFGIKEPSYSVEPMPLSKSRLRKYKHRNIYKNKEKLF